MERTKIPGIQTIIGIVSGKGGTGKTFVATELAFTLAKLGKKTGLIDADIHCPNVFRMLGVKHRFAQTAGNFIIPFEKDGVKLVSMAGLAGEDEPIMFRGPLISKIIQQLLLGTVWGDLDFLIIDFASGMGDSVITLLQHTAVDGLLIVTTSHDLGIFDARKTINMALQLGVPVIGILENMRSEIFGEGSASRLAESMKLPFLGSIPMRKGIANSEELHLIFTRLARSMIDRIMV